MKLLLLPRPSAPDVATVYASLALPFRKKSVRRVGAFSILERLLEVETRTSSGDNSDSYNSDNSDDSDDGWEVISSAVAGAGKRSRYWDANKIGEKLHGLEKIDPYKVLGLHLKRHAASAKEIKDAYRALSLVHHPDRAAAAQKDLAAQSAVDFKQVTASYDLLSDPVRRRQFDSIDAFDDHLPKAYNPLESIAARRNGDEKDDGDDADDAFDDAFERFHRFFAPVFERQKKFSARTPVPSLGDVDASPDEIRRFYAFWENFCSWRDFGLLAECDLQEAEDREERRWMQRQNKAEAERIKRAEAKRLAAFVTLAKENDPRVKRLRVEREKAEAARKEALLAQQRKRREEKERAELEARSAEEDAERAAEEEKEKAIAEARSAARRKKEAYRSRLRRARKALKALGEPGGPWRRRAKDITLIASSASTEVLTRLHAVLVAGDGLASSLALDEAVKACLH